MRHIVNFGLLFCFGTLAVTGAMAFLLPFSLTATRVHILFGMATTLLVGLHLAARVPYFRNQLLGKQRTGVSRLTLGGIAGVWALLLAAAIGGWAPADS